VSGAPGAAEPGPDCEAAGGRAGPEQVESWTNLTKRAKVTRDSYLDLAQQELGTA